LSLRREAEYVRWRVVRDAVVEGGRAAGCGSCGLGGMRIVRAVVERAGARVGRRRRRMTERRLVRRMIVALEVSMVWDLRGLRSGCEDDKEGL
jgi:hypothetical protein